MTVQGRRGKANQDVRRPVPTAATELASNRKRMKRYRQDFLKQEKRRRLGLLRHECQLLSSLSPLMNSRRLMSLQRLRARHLLARLTHCKGLGSFKFTENGPCRLLGHSRPGGALPCPLSRQKLKSSQLLGNRPPRPRFTACAARTGSSPRPAATSGDAPPACRAARARAIPPPHRNRR